MPQAANADEVRAEIARLEKATEEKVQLLFKQAEDLAELLPLQKGEFGYGRRADAFKSIAEYKIDLGDFKGADEDLNKAKRYAVNYQDWYFSLVSDPEYRAYLFAKTLAEAGDTDGALSILDKLKANNKKDLISAILVAMIGFKDLEAVKTLLQTNKVELEYWEIRSIAGAFAEAGDYATAESCAREKNGEPAYGNLAEAHLYSGNVSEAIRCARLSNTWVAMAIRGEADAAFQEMMAVDPTNPYYAMGVEQTFIALTQVLLLLDDLKTAQKAAALSAQFVSKAGYHPARKKIALGYVELAKAPLDIEKEKGSEAVRRMEAVPDKIEWQRDLCNFAIRRGKLAAAEKIADSFTESRERIEFLRQVLAAYESKNDRANAGRLTKKLTGLLADVQPGWDPENPGREIVVNAWMDAAYKLSEETALSDLPACISEIKKNRSPDEMPCYIAYGAETIGKGLLKIRFMDRIYR
ncbi:MAG: hypothetical protein BWY73_00475 [candidate division TA06 bacterium ADurb.Bin417]|uniref:Tetratricopeptide repeat protein n=1 Tax=candidate division TA06 bacterium ADurb.Bin417 TaxID=1852828 RepID=A0A1V5MIS2_UNCT6|nr:MAG: hypothetical protein BWY73_00475 [candidate division TA06 bacterium ADurb.Bin417]